MRFEVAMTAADLQRLAPLLSGGGRIRLEPMSACLEQPGGQHWQITLSNPRVRTLGRLSLPIADVQIEMTGYSQAEIQRFLERFHLVFRKGGG